MCARALHEIEPQLKTHCDEYTHMHTQHIHLVCMYVCTLFTCVHMYVHYVDCHTLGHVKQ